MNPIDQILSGCADTMTIAEVKQHIANQMNVPIEQANGMSFITPQGFILTDTDKFGIYVACIEAQFVEFWN